MLSEPDAGEGSLSSSILGAGERGARGLWTGSRGCVGVRTQNQTAGKREEEGEVRARGLLQSGKERDDCKAFSGKRDEGRSL